MKTSRTIGVMAAVAIAATAVTGATIAIAADDTAPREARVGADHRAGSDGHGPRGQDSAGHGPAAHGQGGHGPRAEGRLLHGESVAETDDGTYVTSRMQVGEVTAASTTSLTVVSADGFTATYQLVDETNLRRNHTTDAPPQVGDIVRVHATVTGATVTADAVMALSADKAAEMDDHRAEMGERRGGPRV
jgi:hypothetical protein